jgi:putative ABC transport system permease protein
MPRELLDAVIQDTRYAVRTLRKTPAFTAVVVALIALAVGANTAIFSVANAVLLKPLPFPDPDRLVLLWEDFSERGGGSTRAEVSPADFAAWKEQNRSFTDVAALFTGTFNLTGTGTPEKLAGALTTGNLFSVLGMQPLLGRTLTAGDDRGDAPDVVVIGAGVWRARFGADPGIVGRALTLNGTSRTVVGVVPDDFRFPDKDAVLWIPARFSPQDLAQRTSYYIYVVARLKPGVELAQAQADMSLVARSLGQAFPRSNNRLGVTVSEAHEHLTREARPAMSLLLGAVAIVLLIASANVANLLLARGAGRRREIALRKVLGARGLRVARQLLTESAILALLGASLGAALATIAFAYLGRLVPETMSANVHPALDVRGLIFTAGIATVVALLSGAGPMVAAGRLALNAALKEGSDRHTGAGRRLRRGLIVAELTLTVVLLVAAGLLLRSYRNVLTIDAGFNPNNVLVAQTVLPLAKYSPLPARTSFYDGVLQRVRALPGVSSASYVNYPPLTFKGGRTYVSIEGAPPPRPEDFGRYMAVDRVVAENYFHTLGIPVTHGREFEERDTATAPLTVVVNQAFARRHWPNADAVGKRLTLGADGNAPWFTVVGVVGDILQLRLDEPAEPEVYFAARQVAVAAPFLWPQHLVVRTTGNPLAIAGAVRNAVWQVDPDQPVSSIRPMSEIFETELRARNTQLTLVAAFAVVALLMAAVGLYGVLSHAVAQQLREIGVRMALGARRRTVVAQVVVDALRLAVVGSLLGLLVSIGVTRYLSTWLFNVSPLDPLTFVVTVVVLGVVALVASSVPALRGASVDPISVLRAE